MAILAPPMRRDRATGWHSARRADSLETGRFRAGRLMMIPALIIPVLLALVFFFGFYLTLRNRRLNRGDLGFVGLDNYGKLLARREVLALALPDAQIHGRSTFRSS